MILTAIKNHALQLGAVAMVALGALLLVQTVRLANAQKETAQAVAALSTERSQNAIWALRQSEKYRQLEDAHREEIITIAAVTTAAIATADADASRARVVHDGMQRDLASFITDHRISAQARAAAGERTPDTTALDLLAHLQRRADERAGELAAIADQARARGYGCERSYDAGQALNTADKKTDNP